MNGFNTIIYRNIYAGIGIPSVQTTYRLSPITVARQFENKINLNTLQLFSQR